MTDRPVVVVTGGGGGIGAAVAIELGRRGTHVVTLDPLVTLDGTAALPDPGETTAGRIVAAGGSAEASSASVTDGPAVHRLVADLVARHGRLDAVVNVAGITRPTGFAKGTEGDWRSVLEVHLDGYRNVLEAALPVMAAAGHGRILGVTSGSGWRAADAGAYSAAKRAVAALTWELGRQAPPGVTVNAISPIAVTRMVTAALERAPKASAGAAATGGLSLGSMPTPEELGPLGAHLVGPGMAWLSGQVLFAGGAEVAVVEPPRLLEVVRTSGTSSIGAVVDGVAARALAAAEAAQATTGGANPRFPGLYDVAAAPAAGSGAGRVLVASDRPHVAGALQAALERRGLTSIPVAVDGREPFEAVARLLADAAGSGPLDAVVVALGAAATPAPGAADLAGWAQVLAEHAGVVDGIQADASWTRSVADHAAAARHPVRLVSLTDATTAGGRSRGQSAAQLARAARRATEDRVSAFAVAVEAPWGAAPAGDRAAAAELAAHLVADPEATALSGAELAVGPGWIGLRSHPRPTGSLTFGGPELPDWFDDALRGVLGERSVP